MAEASGNTTAEHNVEYIDADDGAFSDMGASVETDLTSLTSSIREHVYENGRRYHSLNAGTYALPNDETEKDRLDMFHHATSLMLDGALHVAKLPEKLDRILDLGTGTGIWAIDIADQHPESQVIGVDLSPIQPSWLPPNCSFEVDDIEQPWMWKEPFDFIHSANLGQGLRDWPKYTKQIYEHLVPGGVAEFFESQIVFQTDDDSVPKGGFIERYQDAFIKGVELAGLQQVSDKLEGYLEGAGFVDVKVTIKKIPVGGWAKEKKKKELGKWGLVLMETALKSYGVALFTRHLGMSAEEATSLCDGTFEELRRRDVHTYIAQWFVEGWKPST